jgi:hypothetical protein
LQQVQKAKFCFITKVLSTLLNLIEPVNKQLQTHGFDIHNALSLIDTVREEIAALRNNEKFVEIAGDTVARDEAESQNENARPLARKRKVPERLRQFVAVDGAMNTKNKLTLHHQKHDFDTCSSPLLTHALHSLTRDSMNEIYQLYQL